MSNMLADYLGKDGYEAYNRAGKNVATKVVLVCV